MPETNDPTELLEFDLPPQVDDFNEDEGGTGDDHPLADSPPAETPLADDDQPDEPVAEPAQHQYTDQEAYEYAKQQLEANGYTVTPPAEAAPEKPDMWSEPEAYEQYILEQAERRANARLEPLLRPQFSGTLKTGIESAAAELGIALSPAAKAQIEADMKALPVEALEAYAGQSALHYKFVADYNRMHPSAPEKPKARPVGASITGGLDGETAPTRRVTLTAAEAAEWEGYKAAFGDTQENKRQFLADFRGEK